jgi:muramidase (phage lysozyme)
MATIGSIGKSFKRLPGAATPGRAIPVSDAQSRALDGMGNALSQAANSFANSGEYKAQVRDEFQAQQDKFARANAQSLMIKAERDLKMETAEMRKTMPRGGVGYTDAVEEMAKKRVDEIRRTIPAEIRIEFQPRLDELESNLVLSALPVEIEAQQTAYIEDYDNIVAQAAEEIATGEQSMEYWAYEMELFLNNAPLNELQKEQLTGKALATISTAQLGVELQHELENSEYSTGVTGQEADGKDIVAAGVSGPMRGLLNAIAGPESSGRYNVIHGGSTFDDYSKHPNVKIPIGDGNWSTAAGRYQFIYDTWMEAKEALGLTDFSPESQDRAAIWLAKQRYYEATGNNLEDDLATGNAVTIDKIRRILGGIEGASLTWEALQNVSAKDFYQQIRNSTGTASSLITDERFKNVPYETRVSMNIDTQQQLALQRVQRAEATSAAQTAAVNELLAQISLGEISSRTAVEESLDLLNPSAQDRARVEGAYEQKYQADIQMADYITRVGSPSYIHRPEDNDLAEMVSESRFVPSLQLQDVEAVDSFIVPTINQMGYVPANVVTELGNQAMSVDPAVQTFAMETLHKLKMTSPVAWNKVPNNADLSGDMIYWEQARGVLTPEQINQRLLMTDQGVASIGLETAQNTMKAFFRDNPTKLAPGGIAKEMGLKYEVNDPRTNRVLQTEANVLFEQELLRDPSSPKKAYDRAITRLAERYGETSVGAKKPYLIRRPPEKYYPPFAGTHEYIVQQAREELNIPKDAEFRFVTDAQTEAEVNSGVDPAYQIWYKDQELEIWTPLVHEDRVNVPIRFFPEYTSDMNAAQFDFHVQADLMTALDREITKLRQELLQGNLSREENDQLWKMIDEKEAELEALENANP